MATRALIVVLDKNGSGICNIYKHWDGDPQFLGEKLRKFAHSVRLGDGVGSSPTPNYASGMHCFAAQLVSNLKERDGDVYLFPPDNTNLDQAHIYIVSPSGRQINVTHMEAI